MKFNIRLADPNLQRTSLCFYETMTSTAKALRELGHEVFEHSRCVEGVDIVFGFWKNPKDITQRSIIFQQEPVNDDTIERGNVPIEYLKNHVVWDYSRHNVDILKARGVEAEYIPTGVCGLVSLPKVRQTIDVLFFGNVTEYRRVILFSLKVSGLKVVEVYGLYGEDLDELLARSKVVLNLHNQADFATMESVRVVHCLRRGKAVVSEVNIGDDDDGLAQFISPVAYENLVQACTSLVFNDGLRANLESRSSGLLTARNFKDTIERAVEGLGGKRLGTRCPDVVIPRKIIPPSFGRMKYAKDGCTIDWNDYKH